ncbi:MAG: sulfur carrier protein ThiS [Candidatus Binatia bacterium]
MRVTVNGEPQSLADGLTIADLISQLGLTQQRIAVEVNREIIVREAYATHTLREGDQVEIVNFVGGG